MEKKKSYVISGEGSYATRELSDEEHELIKGILDEAECGSIEEFNPLYEVDLGCRSMIDNSTIAVVKHWKHYPKWLSEPYYGSRYFKTKEEVEDFLKDKTFSSISWSDLGISSGL